MRTLSKSEVNAVSGSELNLIDVGYLWAGYHSLGMASTTLVGTGIGAIIGILNLLTPVVGAAPIVGFVSMASYIALPASMGGALAFIEYNIGSYCASFVQQPELTAQ